MEQFIPYKLKTVSETLGKFLTSVYLTYVMPERIPENMRQRNNKTENLEKKIIPRKHFITIQHYDTFVHP
jgi:hypothetical protein